MIPGLTNNGGMSPLLSRPTFEIYRSIRSPSIKVSTWQRFEVLLSP